MNNSFPPTPTKGYLLKSKRVNKNAMESIIKYWKFTLRVVAAG